MNAPAIDLNTARRHLDALSHDGGGPREMPGKGA
jgi:hypothetical protein